MSGKLSALLGRTKREARVLSFEDYLELCKQDRMYYANAAARLRDAIGPATYIDTSRTPKLLRIYGSRTIAQYDAFRGFYGIETVIEEFVSFLDAAALMMQPYRQIAYFLGPISSGKSSLVRRIIELFQMRPYYTLQVGDEVSPIGENPLGVFTDESIMDAVAREYNIPRGRFHGLMSLWARERLNEFNGDATKFNIIEVWPSLYGSQGIAKIPPPDSDEPESASPLLKALGYTTQGLLELVETFKHKAAALSPLLTASEERYYIHDGSVLPYEGIIIGHSNPPDFDKFKGQDTNGAFMGRTRVFRVLYPISLSAETKIYEDHLAKAGIVMDERCATGTVELVAGLGVLSRIQFQPGKGMPTVLAYDGADPKEVDAPLSRKELGENDGKAGLTGLEPRYLAALLSYIIVSNHVDRRADPIRFFEIGEAWLKRDHPNRKETNLIENELIPYYRKVLKTQILTAYYGDYDTYIQVKMDEYFELATAWDYDEPYKDPNSGHSLNREEINLKLNPVEMVLGITNSKQFRDAFVKFVMRKKGEGIQVNWIKVEEYKDLVAAFAFVSDEDLYNRIHLDFRSDPKERQEHEAFLRRLQQIFGFTERETNNLIGWFIKRENLKPKGNK